MRLHETVLNDDTVTRQIGGYIIQNKKWKLHCHLSFEASTVDSSNVPFLFFTLIRSTLASSFSCSTSRRILDKLELEVMLVEIVLG